MTKRRAPTKNTLRVIDGTPAQVKRNAARAAKLLAKVRPFEEWKAATRPTPREEEMYRFVVDSLERQAKPGPRHTAAIKKRRKP